jgi:hypothetical protein
VSESAAVVILSDTALRVPVVPWASALNATAEHDGIAVTLLALAVVDEHLRLTGVVRVHRRDTRVATIPLLEMVVPGGARLPMVDARVQPHATIVWVAWTYERPEIIPDRFEARISHIELEYRVGGTARVDVPGPWEFSLLARPPALPTVAGRSDGNRRT